MKHFLPISALLLGSAILLFTPDADLAASGIPGSTDIGASLAADIPVRLTDLTTGDRWPYWAEMDATAPPGEQVLMLRPAIALREGHEYLVEVDGLVDGDGNPIEQDLPLEWTFTVASAESLAGRLRSIVAAAYEDLGDDGAPAFEVAAVEGDAVRFVEGTFELPNHLTGDGGPGNRFLLEDGLPVRSTEAPHYPARFRCVLPTAPAEPVPTILFGHGLLGSRAEVDFFEGFASLGLAAACATDWIGMASEDVPTVVEILADISRFAEQADRMQQAHLAFQLLGRLANSPMGFTTHPAFQADDGSPLLAGRTSFLGNSQGGILGGAASAVSTEWTDVMLGVPAMNYNLLIDRSSDWPPFQVGFEAAYPDPVDQVLALQLAQLLWDRGENQAYAQHLTTDPYPGVEAKNVFLLEAFGDHQVANVATEVFARTIGARVNDPPLREGRSLDVEPFWGIERVDAYPTSGATLGVWDFGTPPPPTVNLPPFPPDYGTDPHGAGAEEDRVLQQALGYLLTGQVVDVCAGPCVGRMIDE